MRGLVGSAKLPKGGFGNRAWHFINLRLVARSIEARYFSVNPEDRQRISGVNRPRLLERKLRSVRRFEAKSLLHREGHEELVELVDSGQSVDLKGVMLGEVFARYASGDVRELVSARSTPCRNAPEVRSGQQSVAFHLRAGDFREWNSDAILNSDYYFDAVDQIQSLVENPIYRICTDDPSHPAYQELANWISATQKAPAVHDCLEPLNCDFSAMFKSHVLVSSPSTLSMVAGILGQPIVIQSKTWATQRAEMGELFWQRVIAGSLSDYSVAALM